MSAQLSPRHRRMGFVDADAAYIETFTQMAKGWGWDAAAVEGAIGWGAANQHLPPEKLEESFFSWSQSQGLSTLDAEIAADWRDHVSHAGLPELPAAQFTSTDAQRLREIEETLRVDRSKYERENLGDEMFELIARQQGSQGSGAVTERIAASSDRKAEIERIMRTDRREYFNAGLHEEYAAILRQESGEHVADNQPEPFPAQTPVNLEINE